MPLDIGLILVGVLLLVLAGSVIASLVAWMRRSGRRGLLGGRLRATRDMSPPGAADREGRTGWRALQSAGAARARARNRAEMDGTTREEDELLGKAHRKRLRRQDNSGPWR